jgi:hypothetical protein
VTPLRLVPRSESVKIRFLHHPTGPLLHGPDLVAYLRGVSRALRATGDQVEARVVGIVADDVEAITKE